MTKIISVREMPDFSIGVAVSGQFAGEVILCNAAGWSSLTSHRYWPSAYMLSSRGENRSAYVPDFNVQLIKGEHNEESHIEAAA